MEARPVRVLLVDDDEDDYVATRDLLSEVEGGRYLLDWVATYEEALSAFERDEHDVYLVDHHLGERNGLELLDDASRLGCRAPMILLTGHGDHDVDVRAMKAGAADYLVKGQINPSMLERSIRYAVERGRADQERSVLEDQLQQSQKMDAVGQLAGGIAHDFNNLLTAILGYSQLGITMVPADSRLMAHLQEIQRAAQRAADLTQQLLAFSRRQIIEQRWFNLNELILNTHKMLRRLIGEDIELVTVPQPDLGLAKVDPGQISQVLVNLAINARDAMLSGGKLSIETSNVTISPDLTSQVADLVPGKYVVLAVSDNGIGMTEEIRARIFEPFFTTKEQGKGTGLGLSTCYGIVKQHGGHISVCSESGKGTTFKLYLPRVDSAVEDGHRDNQDILPTGGEKVLLVEDEETVRRMAARILREQGYTVLEAENGGEALRVAEELGDAGNRPAAHRHRHAAYGRPGAG